jgi:hypothetical protein
MSRPNIYVRIDLVAKYPNTAAPMSIRRSPYVRLLRWLLPQRNLFNVFGFILAL